MHRFLFIAGLALTLPVAALAAQTFADDLVVQGSHCVGVDCSSTESFGFNTVILKENNTRLMFLDTSNSGAFPSNDWVLVANDSTNGGSNRFSIEDATASTVPFTVFAGAPDNALVASEVGVGVGTLPMRPFHVGVTDTPVVRLEQTGFAGWPNYTWDIGGNETGFFLRDVTSAVVPWRVLPNSLPNAVVVAEVGVGFGTDAPLGLAHFASAGGVHSYFEDSTSGSVWQETFGEDPLVASGRAWMLAEGGGAVAIAVTHDGNVRIAGTLAQGSSRKIKREIRAVDARDVLSRVNAMDVSTWAYRTDTQGARHMGPMAEDFHRAFGLGEDDAHIAPGDLAGVALASVKALHRVVAERDAHIEQLREANHTASQKIRNLEARLAKLEAMLGGR